MAVSHGAKMVTMASGARTTLAAHTCTVACGGDYHRRSGR